MSIHHARPHSESAQREAHDLNRNVVLYPCFQVLRFVIEVTWRGAEVSGRRGIRHIIRQVGNQESGAQLERRARV